MTDPQFIRLEIADGIADLVLASPDTGNVLSEELVRQMRAAAESLADRVDAAVYSLMGPALVYLYWGDVDKIGHHEGVASWQWGEALTTLDRERVLLMPECVDPARLSADYATLVPVCIEHGLTLGPRLHIAIFGHVPGT